VKQWAAPSRRVAKLYRKRWN